MPSRRSYRPYRRNYGSNKKKWASFLKAATIPEVTVVPGSSSFAAVDFVVNSAQTATPTPTIIKAKHFKLSIDMHVKASITANVIGPIVCYLMYIPQGYTLATTTPTDHPEWVITWRSVDTTGVTAGTPTHSDRISMSSSLSRNLNSGDTIKLVVISSNVADSNFIAVGYAHFSCVVRNN